MNIVYSEHALKRMKQRGITSLEVEHVLRYPTFIKKSAEEIRECIGECNNRTIRIFYLKKETFIKIVTVI